MDADRVQSALTRLKEFKPSGGNADEFVYLSARFCDALSGCMAYEELERRAQRLIGLAVPVRRSTRSEVSLLGCVLVNDLENPLKRNSRPGVSRTFISPLPVFARHLAGDLPTPMVP